MEGEAATSHSVPRSSNGINLLHAVIKMVETEKKNEVDPPKLYCRIELQTT